jgi:hypothetical protein
MAGKEEAFVPTIHERLVAILSELPAIGKTQRNEQQKFMYRGHDDVLNALNPLLAKHGVFVVPDVLHRLEGRRETRSGGVMYEVNLHVGYTFYGAGGDFVRASAWGEGTDSGDKSTNKAMTMAFKNVLAQVFAVSTAEGASYDTDQHSPEETVRPFDPETDLMPGGVKPADAPKALAESWPHVEWGVVLEEVEPGWRDLKGKERTDFFRRLANAVTWMQGVAPPDAMPPITDEQIVAGFAYAFSGKAVTVVRKESDVAEPDAPEDDDVPWPEEGAPS